MANGCRMSGYEAKWAFVPSPQVACYRSEAACLPALPYVLCALDLSTRVAGWPRDSASSTWRAVLDKIAGCVGELVMIGGGLWRDKVVPQKEMENGAGWAGTADGSSSRQRIHSISP